MGRSMFPLFFRHNAHFLPHLKGAIAYSVEKHKDLRVSSFWTGSQSFFFFSQSLCSVSTVRIKKVHRCIRLFFCGCWG